MKKIFVFILAYAFYGCVQKDAGDVTSKRLDKTVSTGNSVLNLTGVPASINSSTPANVSILVTSKDPYYVAYKYKIGPANLDCNLASGYSAFPITFNVPISDNVTAFSTNSKTANTKICVIAVDAEDVAQPFSEATSATWITDRTAPVATFLNLPKAKDNLTAYNITVSASTPDIYAYSYKWGDLQTVDCSDATGYSPFVSASTPIQDATYGLSNVDIRLCVLAMDKAGNVQSLANASTYVWTADTTAPIAVLLGAPTGLSNTKFLDIEVSANDLSDVASYRYKLGLSSSVNCATPTGYSGLISINNHITTNITGIRDGVFVLCVVAVDVLGNQQAFSSATSATWTKNTTAPSAILAGAPTGFSNASALNVIVTATNANFNGYKYKLGESANTDCSVATGYSATIDSATPITDSLTGFAEKQLKLCVLAVSNAVIEQAVPTTAQWTKDTVAPSALLSNVPTLLNLSTGSLLDIAVSAVVPTDLFSYRFKYGNTSLDCASPLLYSADVLVSANPKITSDMFSLSGNTSSANTKLCVLAKDRAGNEQLLSSATTSSWVTDLSAPSATLSGQPTGVSNATALNVTVSSTASDYTTYKFKVGSSASTSCASLAGYSAAIAKATPISSSLASLPDGAVKLCVVAIDSQSNEQALASATMLTWTKDTTAPVALLTGAPTGATQSNTLNIAVSATAADFTQYRYKVGPSDTTDCQVNSGYSLATSSATAITDSTALMPDGLIKLCVVALDNLGNEQTLANATVATWTRDTTAPTATVIGVPNGISSMTKLDATVSATVASDIASYKYKIGESAAINCGVATGYSASIPVATHITSSLLSFTDGAITLCLLASDALNNEQSLANATSLSWTKKAPDPNDQIAPVAVLSGVPTGTSNVKTLNVSVSATDPTDIASYRFKVGPVATTDCSLSSGYSQDIPAATPITSSIATLSDGGTKLCVVASDANLNNQNFSEATSAAWIKDTIAPIALLSGAPSGTSKVTTLNITVSSSSVDFASYRYKLGLAASTDCSLSTNYSSATTPTTKITSSISGLSDGVMRLCVIATDTVGNEQLLTAATLAGWIKDTTAPSASLSGLPTGTNRLTSIDVMVNSGDPDFYSYRYKVGEGASTDCASASGYSALTPATTHITTSIASLADGTIKLCVLPSDVLGNEAALASAVVATWTKDVTAPVPTLSNVPTGTNNIKTLNIAVGSASADIVTYKYKLGPASSTNCSVSNGYSNAIVVSTNITNSLSAIADGAINLCVVGVDTLGNEQLPASATVATWTKDTTAPVAVIINAPSGSNQVAQLNANVDLLNPGDVVTYKFKLLAGTLNPIFCSDTSGYSGDIDVATPMTYDLSIFSGSTNFILCVVAKDALGNEQSYLSSTSVSWTRDVEAPVASITGAPTGVNKTTAINVTIGSSVGDIATYKFKLGSSSNTNCALSTGYSAATPVATAITASLAGVPDGGIRLCVIGADALGNEQPSSSATVANWTKDFTGPTVALTNAPSSLSRALALDVTVSSVAADFLNYKFKVGTESSTDCSNATGYSAPTAKTTKITTLLTGFADGAMKLCVLGIDSLGNEQALSQATTASWTKDTTAPVASLSGVPSGSSSTKAIDVTVSANDPADIVSFRYKIGQNSMNCNVSTGYSVTLPVATHIQETLSVFPAGIIKLCVLATDSIGNEQAIASPTVATWTKVTPTPGDVTPPTATLSGVPSGVNNTSVLNIGVSATDPMDIDTYKFKVGPSSATDCSSSSGYNGPIPSATKITASIAGLADGPLRICVVATDAVPNDQTYANATTATWTKDTTPPVANLVNVPTGVNALLALDAHVDQLTPGDIVSYKYKLIVASSDVSLCSESAGYSADTPVATKMTQDLSVYPGDVAFVLCVVAKDSSGNQQTFLNATAATWMKDTTPPVATLSGVPSGSSIARLLDVTVSAVDPTDMASYRYKLGATGSTNCNQAAGYSAITPKATHIITNLDAIAPGPVTLCALATDPQGNEQALANATSASWTKLAPDPSDVTAPVATLAGHPTGTNNITDLNIAISALDPADIASYRYKLGIAATTDCSQNTGYSSDVPAATRITDSLSGLADGSLKLCVLASDAKPNEQALASATSATWTKDTLAPMAILAGAPAGTTKNTTLNITVNSASADYSHYKYKVGPLSTTNCSVATGYSSPIAAALKITDSITSLNDGVIKLCVLALDVATNQQALASATSATWVKDTTLPVALLANAPSGTSAVSTLDVSIDQLLPGDIVTYQYKIVANTSDISICTDPANYSNDISVSTKITDNLTTYPSVTTFVLCVISTDGAGNQQSLFSATAASWTRDVAAPIAILAGAPNGASKAASIDVTVTAAASDFSFYRYKLGEAASIDCSVESGYSSNIAPSTRITNSQASFADGPIKLCVVALDNLLNQQSFSSATTVTWTKDTTAPVATISGIPVGSSSVKIIDATVSAVDPNDIVSYKYKFGPAIGINCATAGYSASVPVATHFTADLTTFADGNLRLCIIGMDALGNEQSISAATVAVWTKVTPDPNDNIAPTATLSNYPTGTNNISILNVLVSATDPADIATYRFKVGATSAIDCANSASYSTPIPAATRITAPLSSVPDGNVTLCVIAADVKPNEQTYANATSVSWIKDTLGPLTTIAGAPTGVNKQTLLDVTVNSGDGDYVGYKYKVGGSTTDCSALAGYSSTAPAASKITASFSTLADGAIKLCVLGVDNFGNNQLLSSATTATWTKDTTAPTAVILNAPTGFSPSVTLDASVDNMNPGDIATYKYKLVSGSADITSCTVASGYSSSRSVVTGMTDDLLSYPSGTSFVLCVLATDAAGNEQPLLSATGVTWTKDTIPPTAVLSGVPSGASSALALDVTVTATTPGDIIYYRYKLGESASTNCSVGTGYSGITSVNTHITNSLTSFAAGNITLCVVGIDPAFNTQDYASATSATWTRVIPDPNDVTAPVATISGEPLGVNNVKAIDIAISATDPVDIASYKYKLGLSATTVCSDSTGYSNNVPSATHIITSLNAIADGNILLCVVAIDALGNAQSFATATSKNWTKDTTASPATLNGVPVGVNNASVLDVTVSGVVANDVVSYKYKVGPSASTDCSSATNYSEAININNKIADSLSGFADGALRLCVVSQDALGNSQPLSSATVATWSKDTQAPVAQIAGVPTGTNKTLALNVTVSSPSPDYSAYRYKVGSSSNTNCALATGYSVATNGNLVIADSLSSFADGGMRLCVIALDALGNEQATTSATSATWVKDTTGPVVILSGAPTGTSNSTSLDVTVSSTSSDISSFKYKVGENSQIDCAQSSGYSSSINISNRILSAIGSIADGTVKLCAIGVDSLGNEQPLSSATSTTWIKDTLAPQAILSGVPAGSSSVTSINVTVSATNPSDIVSYKYKIGPSASLSCSNSSGYSASRAIDSNIIEDVSIYPAGAIRLCVLAMDAIGNEQSLASATTMFWTRVAPDPNDFTAPQATLSSLPTGTNNVKTLNVSVSATDPADIANYKYKVGESTATDCSSSSGYSAAIPAATKITASLNAIADGVVKLCVVAIDANNNQQSFATAAFATWTKDTVAPLAFILNAPSGINTVTTLDAYIDQLNPGDIQSYKYKLLSGTIDTSLCSLNTGYSADIAVNVKMTDDLSVFPAETSFVLCVIGKDVAGNEQDSLNATGVTWLKDTQAPTALISGAPSGSSIARLYDITITAANPSDISTYEYKIGQSSATTCSSSSGYSTATSVSNHIIGNLDAIPAGGVTLCVVGIDSLGNKQAYSSASSATWTKIAPDPNDVTAPVATISGAPVGTSNLTDLDIAISAVDPADIASYRYKLGVASTTDCSVSSGYSTDKPAATHIVSSISGLGDGPIKLCVIASDAKPNEQSLASATFATWTKDTVAPVATLAGAPVGTSNASALNITVGSASADFSQYKFKVGMANSTDCTVALGYSSAVAASTKITSSLSSLSDGVLRLCVVALDTASNQQSFASATARQWTKDTTAPVAIMLNAPTGITNTLNALDVTIDQLNPGDIVTYQYKLVSNSSDVSACTDPANYSSDIDVNTKITNNLTSYPAETAFVLCVVARDGTGNQQSFMNASARTFTRDIAAPTVALSGVPTGVNKISVLNVTVSSTASDYVSYRYKLGAFSTTDCTSIADYSLAVSSSAFITNSLSTDETYKLCVIGLDSAGNQQALASATSASWTRDTTAPVATVAGVPVGSSSVTSIDVTVSAVNPSDIVSYRAKLGNTSSINCAALSGYSASTPVGTRLTSSLSGFLDGSMTLCVIGMDALGNEQTAANATVATWTKVTPNGNDTTAPTATLANNPTGTNNTKVLNVTVSATDPVDIATYIYKVGASSLIDCSINTGYSNPVPGATPITSDISAVPDGNVTLCVVASDVVPNQQPFASATSVSWIKDATGPAISLAGTPAGVSKATSLNVAVSSLASDFFGYQYKVGPSSSTDCASSAGYSANTAATSNITASVTSIQDGATRLCVVGVDTLGNAQNYADASIVNWTKDTTPPIAVLVNAPSGSSSLNALNVFVDNLTPGDIATYKYKLLTSTVDTSLCSVASGYSGSIAVATAMTNSLSAQSSGTSFVLCVLATDNAGNEQLLTEATGVTWMKDTVAPVATVSGVPSATSSVTSIDATVSAVDVNDIASYKYKIGSSSSLDCSQSTGYSNAINVSTHLVTSLTPFADGSITLCLLAIDAAGNTQALASATSATWTKVSPDPNDVTAPEATIAGQPTGVNNTKTLNVSISAVDPVDIATYRYKLGLSASTNCGFSTGYSAEVPASTKITSSLNSYADGELKLCVVAIDALGNFQPFALATSAIWTKDTTASPATLSGVPTGISSVGSIDIDVSAMDALDISKYKYKLGASTTTDCSDSAGYSLERDANLNISENLSAYPDGALKLCVVAIDGLGNQQPFASATSATWTKDTAFPVAIIAGAPTGASNQTTLDITINGSTVDYIIYRYKLGVADNTDCSAAGGYSSDTPKENKITDIISGLPDGPIKLCAIAIDSNGNTQSYATATSKTWTKDTQAPVAIILNAPTGTNTTTVLDAYVDNVNPGDIVNYKYKLLSATADTSLCSVSTGYSSSRAIATKMTDDLTAYPLLETFVLCVIATDAAGNTQNLAVATGVSWTKDKAAPIATLTGVPTGTNNITSLNIAVSASVPTEIATYKYKIGGASLNCSSSADYSISAPVANNIVTSIEAFPDGLYKLCVLGADSLGNEQALASATVASWTKDTVAPTAVLVDAPSGITKQTSYDITVTATVPADIASYRYRIGLGSIDCTSASGYSTPTAASVHIITSLAAQLDSTYKLCVVAIDSAGNAQPFASSTTATWTKDTTAPVPTLTNVPSGTTNVVNLNITVNQVGDIASYKYKVGSSSVTSCSSAGYSNATPVANNIVTSILSSDDGPIRLCVIGIDSLGNEQAQANAASWTWTKDTTAPVATILGEPSGTSYAKTTDITVSANIPSEIAYYRYKIGETGSTICNENTGYSGLISVETHIVHNLVPLPDGSIKLCVVGSDVATNEQSLTASTQAVWDKVTPDPSDVTPPVALIQNKLSPLNNSTTTDAVIYSVAPDIVAYRYKVGILSMNCDAANGFSGVIPVSTPLKVSIAAVPDGTVKLCVYGIDANGNQYETEGNVTVATWTKDTTAPIATLSGVLTGRSSTTTLNITVGSASADVSSYRYKLGLASTTNCSTSTGYSADTPMNTKITDSIAGIVDGDIRVCVITKDTLGNEQALASATTATWTKDTTPPTAKLTNIPTTGSSLNSLTSFIDIADPLSSDVATYKYKVFAANTNQASKCTQSQGYSANQTVATAINLDLSGYSIGQIVHVCVYATDSAGNAQILAQATAYTWMKIKPTPVATFAGQPTGSSNSTQLSVTVSATDPTAIATYRYKLGLSSVTDCTIATGYSSPINKNTNITDSLVSLADGQYTLCALARDSLGNQQAYNVATSTSWTKDTLAPKAVLRAGAQAPQNQINIKVTASVTSDIQSYRYKKNVGPAATLDCTKDQGNDTYGPVTPATTEINEDTSTWATGDKVNFCVVAIDQAGNEQSLATATYAVWTWDPGVENGGADLTPPVAVLANVPSVINIATPSKLLNISVGATVPTDIVAYDYKIYKGDQSSCLDPTGWTEGISNQLSILNDMTAFSGDVTEPNTHLCVIAIDASNNRQAYEDATTAEWITDLSAPAAILVNAPAPGSSNGTLVLDVEVASIVPNELSSYQYKLLSNSTNTLDCLTQSGYSADISAAFNIADDISASGVGTNYVLCAVAKDIAGNQQLYTNSTSTTWSKVAACGGQPQLFSGGSGYEYDPFKITTFAQLQTVNFFLECSYKLMNDLDLQGKEFVAIGEKVTSTEFFTGKLFDGNGKKISNWNVGSNKPFVGLFAKAQGTLIKDLIIENISMQGPTDIGAIVGHAVDVSIVRSSVSGFVTGGDRVGGLVGLFEATDYKAGIYNSKAAVTIEAQGVAGGLVGRMNLGDGINPTYASGIKDSYTYTDGTFGSIDTDGSAGGLVGRIDGTNNQNFAIYTSYSSQAVVSNSGSIGGLVGSMYLDEYAHGIGYSVSASPLTGTSPGAVSYLSSSDIYSVPYATTLWDLGLTGIGGCESETSSYSGVECSIIYSGSAYFYNKQNDPYRSSLDGALIWDSVNTWNFSGTALPTLKPVKLTAPVAKGAAYTTAPETAKNITFEAHSFDGLILTYEIVTPPTRGTLSAVTGKSVTYTPPANVYGGVQDSFTYQAIDSNGMKSLATKVSIQVTTGCDPSPSPDLGGVPRAGTVAEPRSLVTASDILRINDVGDCHYVLENAIDMGNVELKPLFKESETGFTKSFQGGGHAIINWHYKRPSESNIGFFGKLGPGAQVYNLILPSVDLKGAQNVGGLVGLNNGGVIEGVSVEGSIEGTVKFNGSAIGGLIGYSKGGSVTRSSSQAALIGDAIVGGFVGYSEDTTYQNCLASGDISTTSTGDSPVTAEGLTIGGFVGWMMKTSSAGSPASVRYSYASGSITGTGANYGGFAGMLTNSQGGVVIDNSFAIGAVDDTNSTSTSGGFIGSGGVGLSTALNNVYFDIYNTTLVSCLPQGVSANGCSGVNNANSTPNYFFTPTNAPLSSWDFTSVWKDNSAAVPPSTPTFK